MRVTSVTVWAIELPPAARYAMSSAPVSTPTSIVAEIATDAGPVGWGEACMAGPLYQPANAGTIAAALELLAPAVIGHDPTLIGSVHEAMDGALVGNREARAVIDIACWDLLGQATDRRVCDLLGGPRTDPVPTYHVVGMGSPDEVARQARELQDAGHRSLQLKVGGRPIALDIDSIRAIAGVLEDRTTLFVDANRGWTTGEAVQVSSACRDLRLAIEQPCETYDECAAIRPLLAHPLILDECATDLSAISRQINDGVADGFGLKLTRVGGISALRAIRDLCAATSTPISCDDSWGGDIVAAACVHVGATVEPRLHRGTWIAQPYVGRHYDEVAGPRIVDGHVGIPANGAGLGLSIDRARFGEPAAVYG